MYIDLYEYCVLLMKISKTDNYLCSREEVELLKNKELYYQMIITFIANILEKTIYNRLENYNIDLFKTLISLYLKFDNENYLVNMRNCLCHREYIVQDNEIIFEHELFNGKIDCFEFAKIICKVFGPHHKDDAMYIYLLSCLNYEINKTNDNKVIIKNMSKNMDYKKLFLYLSKNVLIATKKEIDQSRVDYEKIDMSYIEYTFFYTMQELKLYKARLTNQLYNMKTITDDFVMRLYEISIKKEKAARGKSINYFEIIEELNSLEENIIERKNFLDKEKKETRRKIDYINKYNDLYSDNENLLRLLRNSLVHERYYIVDNMITLYYINDETGEESFNCTMSLNDLNKLVYDLCDVLDNKLVDYKSKNKSI